MTITQIQEHKITDAELDRIGLYTDALSDFCENCSGGWSIEWDGCYGRHWEAFDTKREAVRALTLHNDRELALLPRVRQELAEEAVAKRQEAIAIGLKKKALREAKTLGGQHPELAALLVKARNEHKKAV